MTQADLYELLSDWIEQHLGFQAADLDEYEEFLCQYSIAQRTTLTRVLWDESNSLILKMVRAADPQVARRLYIDAPYLVRCLTMDRLCRVSNHFKDAAETDPSEALQGYESSLVLGSWILWGDVYP